jgi:4-amino-4-deoxy-L-arabinose transferase-like glycosyltransferase
MALSTMKTSPRSGPRILFLALACAGCLVPFANKPFHMDDPLFIWSAKQIQEHPWDFYGFNVVWYESEMPMARVTKNPPLASYYIAVAAAVFGWSEVALHLAFLLPAIGVVVGTYILAERFGSRPALAALATLFTPLFLISSTNLMCDTLMLCFWVWAMVLWDHGLAGQRLAPLCLSGILISLSFWTKYFGISLVPLLGAYTLAQGSRFRRWFLALFIPALVVFIYHWITKSMYGESLLIDAAIYRAQSSSDAATWLATAIIMSLSFLGGCVASVFFYSPLLWSRRALGAGAALAGLSLLLYFTGVIRDSLEIASEMREPVVIQTVFFAVAGIGVLALAVADLRTHRDARSLLLFLWVTGTWFFMTFLNWTINGRTILPLAPAAGILLMRRIDRRYGPASPRVDLRLYWPLVPAAALSLVTAAADYRFAQTARTASGAIGKHVLDQAHGDAMFWAGMAFQPGFMSQLISIESLGQLESGHSQAPVIWFSGHWGFQFYMEKFGGQAADITTFTAEPGDVLIVPRNNTNPVEIRTEFQRERTPLEVGRPPWLATMSFPAGAGFYCSLAGPVPFAFGPIPGEVYDVIEFTRSISPPKPPPEGNQ